METIRGLPSTFTVKLFVCILDLLPDKCILQISDYIYQAFPEGDFSSLMPFFICEKEAAYYFILSKECLAVSAHQPLGDTSLPSICYVFDLQNDQILYQQHLFDYNVEFTGFQQNDPISAENMSDKLFVMDFDGDGKSDICHINTTGTRIYTFDCSASPMAAGLAGTYTCLTKSSLENRQLLPGEYNGDGLIDLLVSPSSQNQLDHSWTLHNSKGNGQFESHTFQVSSNLYDGGTYLIQDIDGDGSSDLIVYNTNSFDTFLTRNNTPNTNLFSTPFSASNFLFVQSDINCQKDMSKLLCIKHGIVTRYSFSKNQRKENMMTKVVNSYGVYERNTYMLLDEDDPTTYLKGTDAVFPYMDLCEAVPVLYSNEIRLANNLLEKHEYRYVEAIAHRQGRGFLGFKQIDRYFRGQIYTKTFDPYKYNVQTSEVTPFSTCAYTYYVNTAANRIARVWPKQKIERNLLNGDSITTNFTFNSNGYPTKEEVFYDNQHSRTTTHYYMNQSSAWDGYYLGYLYHEEQIDKVGTDSVSTNWRFTNFYAPMRPKYKQIYINNSITERHSYEYDTAGNVVTDGIKYDTSTSYLNTTYTYNTQGQVMTVTDPLGLTTQYTYNSKGQKATMVDKRGETTTYTYDVFGRESSTTYPDGSVQNISRTWNVASDGSVYAITKTHSGQPTTITYYDALNRDICQADKRFDGVFRYVDKEYDSRGRLHKESLPYRYAGTGNYDIIWNTYEYDDYDRIISQNVNGKSTTFSYNGHSITETMDGLSNTKTYDVRNRLISVTDTTGTITYNLAPDGQPTSIVVSGGGTTNFTYNARRRPTLIQDPCAGNVRFYYNTIGKVSKKTNAKGENNLYTYDTYGRLTNRTTPEFTTTYTYDSLNDLTKIVSSNGVRKTFSYNRFGQLDERRDSVGNIWLKTNYSYTEGHPVTISYQSSNGLQTHEVREYINGHFTQAWKEGYYSYFLLEGENVLGQPTQLQTKNITRCYEYNTYGQQTRRSATINYQYVQDISYGISPQFQSPTLREDNIHQTSETFGYDNLCRLNRIGNQHIYYDLKGNITSWDGVGTFNYSNTYKPYTLSGITNPSSLVQQTAQDITYTSFSRPDSIMGNGYSARFVYDEDGNRVKMTLSHNGNVVSTHYYLDGNYEMIVDSLEQTTENLYYFGDYYHATAVYQRQRISNLTTNWTYNILRDHLGSITHIIREDGQLIQELSYDAWGRLRDPQTLAVYTPGQEPVLFLGRGYTGHEHLQEFGLINMNARLYDPAIGRFLSPDPYVQMPENSQNFNRYSYCLNNPLKYTDKSGNWFLIDDFVIGCIRGLWNGENVLKTGYKQAANAFKIWEGLFTLDSNKSFWGKTWELVSRFTWQSFQTRIGFLYALTNNTIGNVSQVRHLYGATVVTQSSNWLIGDGQAVTLGNFITGGDNLKADPRNSLFQHEYGHYIQSQIYGFAYMTGIGLPSLKDVMNNHDNHKYNEIERDANYRAYKYFCKHVKDFGPTSWNFDLHPLLPSEDNDADHYYDSNYLELVKSKLSVSPEWWHYPLGFVMAETPIPIF